MSPADTRRNSEKLGLEEPWWVEKSAPGEQASFGKQLNRVGGGPRSWTMGFMKEELGMGSLASVRRSNLVGAVGCRSHAYSSVYGNTLQASLPLCLRLVAIEGRRKAKAEKERIIRCWASREKRLEQTQTQEEGGMASTV